MATNQSEILQTSIRLVSRLNRKKFWYEFVSYFIAVNLILYVLGGSFQWLFLIIVPILTGIYLWVRHLMMAHQLKKIIMGQYEFITKNHPDLSLFIPMMDEQKNHFSIKRAALYFVGDQLFLDAFHQTGFASIPNESISISYGKDFQITNVFQSKDTIVFEGQLIDTAYSFALVRQATVMERMSPYFTIKEKEVL